MNKNIILICLLSVCALGIIFGVLFYLSPPKIMSISPANDSVDADTNTQIRVSFNKKTNEEYKDFFTITAMDPVQPRGDFELNGKDLIFKPLYNFPLLPYTKYQVTIRPAGPTGWRGTTKVYSFTTKGLESGNILPKDLMKEAVKYVDTLEDKKDPKNIIAAYLPYSNDYFSMDFKLQESGEVTYIVLLKNNQQESKRQFLNWIKPLVNNFDKLKIQYLEQRSPEEAASDPME